MKPDISIKENYIQDETKLIESICKLILSKNLKLAVAESCTGGLLTSKFVSFSGASKILLEGCVTYSNESKMSRLSVSKDSLENYGAVSPQVAHEMAVGIANNLGADIGLSTTGIAGPDGGSSAKPVGLVYFGIYYKNKVITFSNIFSGDRNTIRNTACVEILNKLRLLLLED